MAVSIDFETRSPLNLKDVGVYPYAQHPDTDIWCVAFKVDEEPTRAWSPFVEGDLMDQERERLTAAIQSGAELRAWNSGFEHVIYRHIMVERYDFPSVPVERWMDTAAEAKAMAMPGALGNAAHVLGTQVEKDDEGHQLMLKMCRPRATGAWWAGSFGPYPTKADAVKARPVPSTKIWRDEHTLVWWDDPEMLRRLVRYCIQDVEAEHALTKVLRRLPSFERRIMHLTARMNDRGIYVDTPLVEGAIKVVERAVEEANDEVAELTGGAVRKVTQMSAMLAWVRSRGVDTDSLKKDKLQALLETKSLPWDVRRVLQLRQETGKTSTGKLQKMLDCRAPEDGRLHGLLSYHVASTGRWAGRLVQPQNFPRPEMDPEPYIPLVRAGNYEELGQYGPPAVIVSSLLRSMLRAGPGMTFFAADYSQIEARVLAWLAGQDDLVQLFAEGGLVYETMAAQIFDKAVEDVTSTERQLGKNAVLGAGFQMGAGRFRDQVMEQGGGDIGEELAEKAIAAYRQANDKIVEFWHGTERTAISATEKPGVPLAFSSGRLKFEHRGKFLNLELPSTRILTYAKPDIQRRRLPEPHDHIEKNSLTYLGVNTLTNQWTRHHTYGGHLVENIVQATARDIMASAMLRLEAHGFSPVLTVHDEVVVEVPEGHDGYDLFLSLVATPPAWAEGLPISVEGWHGERYRK